MNKELALSLRVMSSLLLWPGALWIMISVGLLLFLCYDFSGTMLEDMYLSYGMNLHLFIVAIAMVIIATIGDFYSHIKTYLMYRRDSEAAYLTGNARLCLRSNGRICYKVGRRAKSSKMVLK